MSNLHPLLLFIIYDSYSFIKIRLTTGLVLKKLIIDHPWLVPGASVPDILINPFGICLSVGSPGPAILAEYMSFKEFWIALNVSLLYAPPLFHLLSLRTVDAKLHFSLGLIKSKIGFRAPLVSLL